MASGVESDEIDLELGTLVRLEADEPPLLSLLDWNEWDGGKVGGRPVSARVAAMKMPPCLASLCNQQLFPSKSADLAESQ